MPLFLCCLRGSDRNFHEIFQDSNISELGHTSQFLAVPDDWQFIAFSVWTAPILSNGCSLWVILLFTSPLCCYVMFLRCLEQSLLQGIWILLVAHFTINPYFLMIAKYTVSEWMLWCCDCSSILISWCLLFLFFGLTDDGRNIYPCVRVKLSSTSYGADTRWFCFSWWLVVLIFFFIFSF